MGTEYLADADTASSIAGLITKPLGYAKNLFVATAAETVSTLWNSLLPEAWEVDTHRLLNAIDRDAGALLEQDPESVHLASGIAGVFIPGGIGMKMLTRFRNGSRALGYSAEAVGASFVGSKQRALSTEIEALFRESGPSTSEYKTTRRRLLASNMMQQVADNLVLEAAIVGGMNAHPWMEDYGDEPFKNFALGAGIGGILGAGFAIPITKAIVRGIEGPLATQAFGEVVESGVSLSHPSFTNSARYQMHSANVKILENFISDQSKSGLARDIANSMRIYESEAAARAVTDAAPWIKEIADNDTRKAMAARMGELISDPDLIGVDKILRINMDKVSKETARPAVLLGEGQGSLAKTINEKLSENYKVALADKTLIGDEGKAETIFVRLGSGEVFGFAGGRNASLAADLPNIQALLKDAGKTRGINFVSPIKNWTEDTTLGTRTRSSAQQDADFLRELVAASKIPEDQLGAIAIAPDHLPRMNGILSAIDKMDPETAAKVKIRITGDYPTYYAQKQFVEKTVSPSYWRDAEAIVSSEKYAYKNRLNLSSRLDENVSAAITAWIHGGKHPTSGEHISIAEGIAHLRRGFDSFLRGTAPLSGDDIVYRKLAERMWELGEGFRREMKKVADEEGYVYLYRKLTKDPVGAAAVESFTIIPDLATIGGKATLFRVHTDNIIGSFGVGKLKEYEILVGSPHHQIVNNVPIATPATTKVDVPGIAETGFIGADDLRNVYYDATEKFIKDMNSTEKFSVHEISARSNVDVDGVMQVLGGASLKDSQHNWRRYHNVDEIARYVGDENRLFAVRGNPARNHAADTFAGLDRKAQRQMHLENAESLTDSSGSHIARSLLSIFTGNEDARLMVQYLDNMLPQINNQLVGNPTFQSADNAFRAIEKGGYLVGLGKHVTNMQDKIRRDILEPLTGPLIGLQSKPTALLEMNRVINKLYSMRGWRDIVHDEITDKWVLVSGKSAQDVTFVTHGDGRIFYIEQPEVVSALNALRDPSKELLRLHNLNRKMKGQAPLNDLGFYVPPISLVNKNYAFAIDRYRVKGTQLLVANNAEELESQISSWQKLHADNVGMEVLRKGEAGADQYARAYTEGDAYVTYANVAEQHAGTSSLALLPTDERLVNTIMQGYETSILQGGRAYLNHYLRDTTGWLDHFSEFYQRAEKDQPKRGLNKSVARDAAVQAKNVLLGQDQLRLAPRLQYANNMTEFLINSGARAIEATHQAVRPSDLGKRAHFDKLNEDLRAAGVTEPLWGSFDSFLSASIPETRNLAPSIVSAGNGLIATAGLRFLEGAHAAVNLMSLPILTWSALMERLPATPIGASGTPTKFPLRLMMDGIRHMYSQRGRELETLWNEKGLIDLTLRQFDDVTTRLKSATLGKGYVERATNAAAAITNSTHPVMQILTGASDWTERFTRRFAMHTGYLGAKTAYPGIDDTAATLAAMNFADRTVGNYHAAQRPTMFQGTLGAVIGLYQTYMLTFAQHVYRGLETRNFKQLGGLMLAQAGIFGLKGLPGYGILSEQIVANFSQDNYDLTTGLYRSVGDPTAELILYGLPSSITGTAFYTRGDISPRIPGTVTDLALLNSATQGYELVSNIFSKVAQGAQDNNMGRAFLEAISLQSINRPVARWAEILQGSSITSQGNTVSTADEIYTPIGVAARMLGARPLEEQIAREAVYLNRFYKARDFENRQKAVERIKRGLRSGELSDETISDVSMDYFRNGGSAQGWKGVMNEGMVKSDLGMRRDLLRKLEPDSPLNHMIGDLY
jgi:hypothetical protein